MQQAIEEGVEVPVSALLQEKKKNRYGSVPGLDDEELADPQELERQAFREEWGPILALPERGQRHAIRPDIDESGGIDWGAFATVDFERSRPAFDRARYKVERLREELASVLLMFDMVQDRLPKAKYLVLKYLQQGVIELDQIASEDMLALARLHRRAERIRQEIREIQERRWQRTTREVLV
jgi:hypothetical protein